MHLRVQTAWLHLGSVEETTWLALGGQLLSFLGLETSVGPPFPVFKPRFSGWHFLRDLIRCLLIDMCGQSHISAKDG